MEIIEYFSTENQEHWLSEIGRSDWGAGRFLHQLLAENRLKEMVGETALVPMLVDGEKLIAFCTFAPLDDIQPTELDTCTKGFYRTDNDGADACKAQAMFIRKYGEEKFFRVHDKMHETHDFKKTQEFGNAYNLVFHSNRLVSGGCHGDVALPEKAGCQDGEKRYSSARTHNR